MIEEVTNDIIKKELAKKDFEMISIVRRNADGGIEITAQKLHPVKLAKKSVFVHVPVTLLVYFDNKNQISTIEEGSGSQENIVHAKKNVKDLIKNKNLAGVDNVKPEKATHSIITNEKGQAIIKRNRFNAF